MAAKVKSLAAAVNAVADASPQMTAGWLAQGGGAAARWRSDQLAAGPFPIAIGRGPACGADRPSAGNESTEMRRMPGVASASSRPCRSSPGARSEVSRSRRRQRTGLEFGVVALDWSIDARTKTVRATANGDVTRAEFDALLDAVVAEDALAYRKLFDGSACDTSMSHTELMEIGVRLKSYHDRPVGALAM